MDTHTAVRQGRCWETGLRLMSRLSLPIVAWAVAGCLSPQRARAHAILMDSTPAARTEVPAGPVGFKLRFNSRVDHARSRLMLRAGPAESVLPIDPVSAADVLAASATLTPGEYVMRWQVLAVDGHITRGDVPFTVKGP